MQHETSRLQFGTWYADEVDDRDTFTVRASYAIDC